MRPRSPAGFRLWRTTEVIPGNSTSLAVIDRRNGQVVASVPFPDDQNPDLFSNPNAAVWHYIRFDYFKTLLNNRAIWFTRLDNQKDKSDGTYSHTNASEMTGPLKVLLAKFGVQAPNWEQLVQTNSVLRRLTFVHCWSIRPHESAWMWHSFLEGDARSVAVRSTIDQVHYALDGQPVDLKRILYCPVGSPRPDYSYDAPFTAKDKANHEEEREMRLIMTLPIGSSEKLDHQLVPINLKKLIGSVISHPLSSPEFRDEVRLELKKHSIGAPVSRSWIKSSELKSEVELIRNTLRGKPKV